MLPTMHQPVGKLECREANLDMNPRIPPERLDLPMLGGGSLEPTYIHCTLVTTICWASYLDTSSTVGPNSNPAHFASFGPKP